MPDERPVRCTKISSTDGSSPFRMCPRMVDPSGPSHILISWDLPNVHLTDLALSRHAFQRRVRRLAIGDAPQRPTIARNAAAAIAYAPTAPIETIAVTAYLAAPCRLDLKIFALIENAAIPASAPSAPPTKNNNTGKPPHMISGGFSGSTTEMVLSFTSNFGVSNPRSCGFHLAITSSPSLRLKTISRRFFPRCGGIPLTSNLGPEKKLGGRTSIRCPSKPSS